MGLGAVVSGDSSPSSSPVGQLTTFSTVRIGLEGSPTNSAIVVGFVAPVRAWGAHFSAVGGSTTLSIPIEGDGPLVDLVVQPMPVGDGFYGFVCDESAAVNEIFFSATAEDQFSVDNVVAVSTNPKESSSCIRYNSRVQWDQAIGSTPSWEADMEEYNTAFADPVFFPIVDSVTPHFSELLSVRDGETREPVMGFGTFPEGITGSSGNLQRGRASISVRGIPGAYTVVIGFAEPVKAWGAEYNALFTQSDRLVRLADANHGDLDFALGGIPTFNGFVCPEGTALNEIIYYFPTRSDDMFGADFSIDNAVGLSVPTTPAQSMIPSLTPSNSPIEVDVTPAPSMIPSFPPSTSRTERPTTYPAMPEKQLENECFRNNGFEYLTRLIDGEHCLLYAAVLSTEVCNAVGGYAITAFDEFSATTPVACCPKKILDLKKVEKSCTIVEGDSSVCGSLVQGGGVAVEAIEQGNEYVTYCFQSVV